MKRISLLLLTIGLLFITHCSDDSPTDSDQLLLDDEELTTSVDSTVVVEYEEWIDWIEQNHTPIRSLTSDNFEDLHFLKPLIGKRSIVQLGENGHGVAEFGRLKTRLIKFLHTEMDFGVIAFHSGLLESYFASQEMKMADPELAMTTALYDVWHTEDVVALFDYIQETQETDRPLHIAGIDIKFSSPEVAEARPAFLREVLQPIDPGYAQEIFEADSTYIHRWFVVQYVAQERENLLTTYSGLLDYLDTNWAALEAVHAAAPQRLVFARKSVATTLDCIRYMSAFVDVDSDSAHTIRGEAMAESLELVRQILFPGKKIVIWSDNTTVRHHNQAVLRDGITAPTMGHWLKAAHNDNLYTIGFTMHRGQAALDNRVVFDVETPARNSLEAVLYFTRKKFCFLDVANQTLHDGNAWLFEGIATSDRGYDTARMIVHDQYDGLIFVDSVSAPVYLSEGGSYRP